MLKPVYIVVVDSAEYVSERQYAEALIYFIKNGAVEAPPDPADVPITKISLPQLKLKLQKEFMPTAALLLGAMTEQHEGYEPFFTITDDTYSQHGVAVNIRHTQVPGGFYTCVIHVKRQ